MKAGIGMKIKLNETPRVFTVGKDNKIEISDWGKIQLNFDEQITFVTESDKQYDVVAKSWGFYATPSVNKRLKNEGFKTALVKNEHGNYYIMVVDKEKLEDFKAYLEGEKNKIQRWLDEL